MLPLGLADGLEAGGISCRSLCKSFLLLVEKAYNIKRRIIHRYMLYCGIMILSEIMILPS